MRTLLTLLLLCCTLCAETENEKAFTDVYKRGLWGYNEQGESFSGPGSEPGAALPYIHFIQEFIAANQIKTIVDLGCGDWTLSRHINWRGASYHGFDVVKSLIERNRRLYSSETVQFSHLDGAVAELPEADLLICKDVLQHLTNADIQNVLGQAKHFKHCIFVNDVEEATYSSSNPDIKAGDYRCLDISQTPFNAKCAKLIHFKVKGDPLGIKEIVYLPGGRQ